VEVEEAEEVEDEKIQAFAVLRMGHGLPLLRAPLIYSFSSSFLLRLLELYASCCSR
jgi:hypothetical protein